MTKLVYLALPLVLSTLASLAQADIQQYGMSPEGAQPEGCPPPMMVQIETASNSLTTTHLTLQLPTGPTLQSTSATYERNCLAKGVCEGSDDFLLPIDIGNSDIMIVIDAENALVKLTHNNDGKRPTRDLPGFAAIELQLMSKNRPMVTCLYDLK